MYPTISPETALHAAKHLSRHDVHLTPIIAQFGPCTIKPHTNYYQQLVRSIIGQQLSVKAAASIIARFTGLFNDQFPTPNQLLNASLEDLRSVGFSRSKAAYVQDLARHVLDGRVSFDIIDSQTNQTIITELIAVKGIGEWTAHMFLMFAMGRSDVLPTGDLGIRTGMQKLYHLEHLPSPSEMTDVATKNSWQPYQSIASWYIWQSPDNAPSATVPVG